MLYWPLLVLIVLASYGLSRLSFLPLRWWQWLLLLIGLSQVPALMALLVILWFPALALRERLGARWTPEWFGLTQLSLVLWTVFMLVVLFATIRVGLLESPQMHVEGNGSLSHALNWFQDRSGALLPQARVISLPLLAYRLTMLAWALWLAASLMSWLRWAYAAFSKGGLWKSPSRKARSKPGDPESTAAPPPIPGGD